MNNDFKDKTVIITGASAGVGAETAREFAKMRAKLVKSCQFKRLVNHLILSISCIKTFSKTITL
jgi:NADP-dependent 3-hydroxy acid dehydrogenase YdfG